MSQTLSGRHRRRWTVRPSAYRQWELDLKDALRFEAQQGAEWFAAGLGRGGFSERI